MKQDTFKTDIYDSLHDTPIQRKFRAIAPIPVGVVFIQHPDMTEEDIRGHFRTMKELGFNALKQIMPCRGTSVGTLMHWALDEGIIPWWYGEGGWEEISDRLLDELGIARDTPAEKIRTDDRFLAHQTALMRRRIDSEHPDTLHVPADAKLRETFSFDMELNERRVDLFVEWLKERYGTIASLMEAWNMHHAGIRGPRHGWESWDDVEQSVVRYLDGREYRRTCDVIRFKADTYLKMLRKRSAEHLAKDPHAPVRAGGEMGLFLPFAARVTDMEGIADVMADTGSFYPSIHLGWHFEETDYRIIPEVYLQASLMQDWFKGGWAAAWESTGGPQQLSGGKGMIEEVRSTSAGFTVDGGVMTQLMLSYLGAGFKGFGLWCWTARSAGWEGGEYALTDINGKPSDRAVAAGKIGRAAAALRDELWQARKEPLVGVYTDFDSDATWAAISHQGRDFHKYMGVRGRVGIARALCVRNVPWEHVTATDIRKWLAGRYPIIYLPTIISMGSDLIEILTEYVRRGGRLVMDQPGIWYDEFGRVIRTAEGSPFETLFGCVFHDRQYSSNVVRTLRGRALEGFVCDLTATSARVVEKYGDGRPAITENRLGKGRAVILGYEGALGCFADRSPDRARLVVADLLGENESPYSCDGAYVYRLAAPSADHYFLVNDGPPQKVKLDTGAFTYVRCTDAVSGKELAIGKPIPVEAWSGRWLRFKKTTTAGTKTAGTVRSAGAKAQE